MADLPYIDALREREKRNLGFISLGAYGGVILQSGPYARPNARLWLATAEDEPVGFLYATAGRPGATLKIVQVALQRDARRREYGTALVQTAEAWAQKLQRTGVSCRVRTDIEARAFWDALGYEVAGVERGGKYLGAITNNAELERRYRCLPCELLTPVSAVEPAG